MDLRLQFLDWIASQPRTYGETMDAWRSTCPRLSIWEDALADGLVQVEHAGAMSQARVTLTARGRTALNTSPTLRTGETPVPPVAVSAPL